MDRGDNLAGIGSLNGISTSRRARLEAVGELHRARGLGEALSEGDMDAVLDRMRLALTLV